MEKNIIMFGHKRLLKNMAIFSHVSLCISRSLSMRMITSGQTHYCIFGCAAAAGAASGGGQMKDNCTAVGMQSVCVCV